MPAPKLPCQKGGAFSARGVHVSQSTRRWRRVAVNIRCPKGGIAEPAQSAGKFVRPKKDETAPDWWRKMNPRGVASPVGNDAATVVSPWCQSPRTVHVLFPWHALIRSGENLEKLAHPARFELTTSAFGG